MGLFSNSTPFDADVEKITDEKNTSEDWGMIMDLCDRVQATANGPRDCLKSITKRLQHQDPHVVMQAVTLLDACVNNCGKPFKLEVASRDFENEFKKLLGRSHQKVQEKLKAMLKKWAEVDFKGEPQLALIPALYNGLRKEGIDFSHTSSPAAGRSKSKVKAAAASKDPNVVSSQQEEDDIAKAIQLSLAESKSGQKAKSGGVGGLYPTASDVASSGPQAAVSSAAAGAAGGPEQKKARALYDFEAAEDNELTFKAGEIVIITDDSDVNWWKGSNHRGEGLFPANFVTKDLETASPEVAEDRKQRRRSVQFNEEVEVKTVPEVVCNEISEERIDSVLDMLNEADPTSPESDPRGLAAAEDGVNAMGPLIDAELEAIDRRHAQLTRISTELVDALNLYHQLMHDAPMQYGMQQHAMHAPYPPPMYMSPPPGGQQMYYPSPAAPSMDMMNGQGYPAQQYPPQAAQQPMGNAPPMNDPNAYQGATNGLEQQVLQQPMSNPGSNQIYAPTTNGAPVDINSQHFATPLPTHQPQQPANPSYVMNNGAPSHPAAQTTAGVPVTTGLPQPPPPAAVSYQQVPPMN